MSSPTALVEGAFLKQANGEEPGRVVFESTTVKIGSFRCPVSHPKFRNSGAIGEYTVAFPRTSVWIQHEHERPFVTDPTMVTLYNPDQEYERRANDPKGDICEWMSLSPPVVAEMLASVGVDSTDDERRLLTLSSSPIAAATYLEQRNLYNYIVANPAADALFVEERALGIWFDVLQGAYRRPFAMQQSRRRAATRLNHRAVAQEVRAVISRTFAEPHSLRALAAQVGTSAFHLCRIFRTETGQTIHAYLTQLRLRASLEGILDTKIEILPLALDLGFCSHSHFTAAFRRCFGINPSAVRRGRVRRANSPSRSSLTACGQPWRSAPAPTAGSAHPPR